MGSYNFSFHLNEREEISNDLFPERHERYIYPVEFFNRILRYHRIKQLNWYSLENKIGMQIIPFYFTISQKFRNSLVIQRTIIELKQTIPVFRDFNIFEYPDIINSTRVLLTEMYYSQQYIDEWMILLKEWFKNINFYGSKYVIFEHIQELCEMMNSFYSNTNTLQNTEEAKIINTFVIDTILKLFTSTHSSVKKTISYLTKKTDIPLNRRIIQSLFYDITPFSTVIRNRLILRYFCQERKRGTSIHNIIFFMRSTLIFDDDCRLYQSLTVIFLGLNKLTQSWLLRKKVPYLIDKSVVIQELKSHPPCGVYPGGEDYWNAMKSFENKIIN